MSDPADRCATLDAHDDGDAVGALAGGPKRDAPDVKGGLLVEAGLPAAAGVPAGVRAGGTRAARVPAAGPVPMARVAGVAVVKVVVVAAAPVPVETPARVPSLAGTPVIVGQRPGRPGNAQRRSPRPDPQVLDLWSWQSRLRFV